MLGLGIKAGSDDQYQHGQDRRPQQGHKALAIAAFNIEDAGDDQGTDHGARLVHGGMEAEAPAPAHLGHGMGEHGVPGRGAQALAQALQHQETGGHLPVARQGQERHGEEIQGVAPNGQGPIAAGAVRQVTGSQPQGIAQEFTQARHRGHHDGAGFKLTQERAADAAGPFIGHVAKEADHAYQDDEFPGRGLGGIF